MPRRQFRKSAARRYPAPIVDLLEARQLLSTTPVAVATSVGLSDLMPYEGPGKPQSTGGGTAQVTYLPIVGPFNPTQLETAYGVNLLGAANQGQGVTIAIVDEGDDTSAIADVNSYSSYYGLPQFNTSGGPTMSVIEDSDLDTVGTAKSYGTGGETSIDLDMVHAIAPKANLILVEVPATVSLANEIKELVEGVQFAATPADVGGVQVAGVSLSYGTSEANVNSGAGNSGNVANFNATYLATGAATNVVVTVSTGDGSTPGFPATSPNVVAVGGTSLFVSSARGKYAYETAWGGLAGAGAGGGGASTAFAAPAFQYTNGVSSASGKRLIPDVSMEADDISAVSYYDSYDAGGGDPWSAAGGTSVAAPLMQGVIALAQQERILAGLPILTSAAADTAFYDGYNSLSYSTLFHDVTLGKNTNVNSHNNVTVTGFSAVAGYDEATGIGSPIANTLVPYLNSSTFAALPAVPGAGVGTGSDSNGSIIALVPPTASSMTTTTLMAAAAAASTPPAGTGADPLVLTTGLTKTTSPLL